MSEEAECECPKEECEAGAPAWVMTFADLMSLLMCFFVLLLAFSEMDVKKFKQLAGSMDFAFGVQREVDVKDIPRGTSVIAQEFSPGKPTPTPLNVVQQQTTSIEQRFLETDCPVGPEKDKGSDSEQDASTQMQTSPSEMILSTQQDAMEIAEAMEPEIKNGQVEVETRGRKIIIRVKEHGSFASGSATLRPGFIEVMGRMRHVLSDVNGVFNVEGHTDDVPINTPRFRSNWELSAARAASVAHELMKFDSIDDRRFTIVGYGDTKPLVPNMDYRTRAKNRRVEIVIQQGGVEDRIKDDLEVLDAEEFDEAVQDYEQERPQFDFDLDEIF